MEYLKVSWWGEENSGLAVDIWEGYLGLPENQKMGLSMYLWMLDIVWGQGQMLLI